MTTQNFRIRTDDIALSDVAKLFVDTKEDRRIINELKTTNPVVLVGSRGVGKSFLLRVAEYEINKETPDVIPVYVNFREAPLIRTADPLQFRHWMLARLCSRMVRELTKHGLLVNPNSAASILAGGDARAQVLRVEQISKTFESSWQNPGKPVDTTGIPTVELFGDAIEDLCNELDILRFSIFFDEAAHVFWPAQQREFFTLFRELRSPYISCNAAVYPGVTSYGNVFQPTHDATLLTVERNVLSESYIPNMREIVCKQADLDLTKTIARRSASFAALAYAASGNPRLLLKTISRVPALRTKQVNEIIKEYYRVDIWSEHSGLAQQKYAGHTALIDWGRSFMETEVLPDLQKKNESYLQQDKKTTSFFWIHRDAPRAIVEALRLLAYTGIVTEDMLGIKATRGEIGTRYRVNLGCLLAMGNSPEINASEISENLTPRRMSEFGPNHPSYASLLKEVPDFTEIDNSKMLTQQLAVSTKNLDISLWQREALAEIGVLTVGDILRSGESGLKKAYYTGEKRARRVMNEALSAVFEYLSG